MTVIRKSPGYFDKALQRWVWQPTPVETVSSATSEEWAWAAGLFEGEGCIYVTKRRPETGRSSRPCLALRTTDKDVIDRFIAIVGVGHCAQVKHHRTWKPHFKEAWDWRLTNYGDMLMLERQFRPWLGCRRSEKFREVVEMNPPLAPGGLRKSYCRRGHPLDGPKADVRVFHQKGRTSRQCRPCVRLKNRAARALRKLSQLPDIQVHDDSPAGPGLRAHSAAASATRAKT